MTAPMRKYPQTRAAREQAITTLTNQKADLLAAINNLVYPRGNTHIPVGAVWGWRLLSPEWHGALGRRYGRQRPAAGI